MNPPSKIITQIPQNRGIRRWEGVARILRSLKAVTHDFSGELRLNFRSGGISTVVRTEAIK